MEREITFIHAADLHLDSPFKGLVDLPQHIFHEIKESTFQALDNLVQAAIQHQVDFVLIVGDLLDHDKQSLKAQIRLRQAFEQLKSHGIDVYMSYGNHDYVSGNVHQVTYPANVHIFPDEIVRTFVYKKDGRTLAEISGFSYEQRAVMENKAREYVIENENVPYHIAMLHGSVQGNEEHQPYAPFLVSELVSKAFDYWALGHIHKRQILKTEPPIVYPGNIQGRHRKETGEKGCYLVKLSKRKTELSFLPLHAIEFRSLTVDIDGHDDIFQLESLIMEKMDELDTNTPQLIDLTLHTNDSQVRRWQTDGRMDDLLEIINEQLASQSPWRYIFRMALIVEERLDSVESGYGEHFLGELNRSFAERTSPEHLTELFHHKQARKYLDFPAEEELQEWRREVRTRLFDELLKGGGR